MPSPKLPEIASRPDLDVKQHPTALPVELEETALDLAVYADLLGAFIARHMDEPTETTGNTVLDAQNRLGTLHLIESAMRLQHQAQESSLNMKLANLERLNDVRSRMLEYALGAIDEAVEYEAPNERSLCKLQEELVAEMPPLLRNAYEAYIERAVLRVSGENNYLFEWLSGGAGKDQPGATSEQLLNFLQWNKAQTEAYNNNPEVKKRVERHVANFQRKVERFVANGILPASVLESVQAVSATDIVVGDRLAWGVEVNGTAIMGHYANESGKVIMGRRFNQHLIDHELGHKAIQSDSDTYPDWFIEAITEDIAFLMDETNMDKPPHYRGELKLLHFLANGGVLEISRKLFYAAYCERADVMHKRDELAQALRESFPWCEDIFALVQELYEGEQVQSIGRDEARYIYIAGELKDKAQKALAGVKVTL